MHQYGKFKYGESESYQIIRIPYEKSAYAMVILMATDQASASNALNGKHFEQFVERVAECGELVLPRFSLRHHTVLTSILKHVGLAQAFSDTANFSRIALTPLKLSRAMQEIRVAVDETGTVAAAATVLTLEPSCGEMLPPYHMRVNKPFYFAIREDSTKALLFIGRVVTPQ